MKWRGPAPNLPHPDSPVGRYFDWRSLDLPHPDSPAGRLFDWQSVWHKRADLKEQSKRPLLRVPFSSVGTAVKPAEVPAESSKPQRAQRAAIAEKTWIEIRVIDENGDPVPRIAYKLTLPDGTTKNGNLDEQGGARFDNIDPGQCQFTLTEIDAGDWRPA